MGWLRDHVAADQARRMTMAPLFAEMMGDNVRRLELRHDGPIPAAQLEHAEQQERAASAAREADPTLALALRIVAAEQQRDTTMALYRELAGWLAERTGVDDAEFAVFEHSSGSSSARMYQHRDEAAELRTRVVADLRLVTRLNGLLAEMVERRAAA